jgi:hypothetical protein
MPQPGSNPNAQASTLRNLKVLVVLLVFSNIFVGVLSVYLLRAVDQRYSELVGQAVPALNDLRQLMSDTVTVMRSTNPNNLSGANGDAVAALLGSRQRLAQMKKSREEAIQDPYFAEKHEAAMAISQTGLEFDGICAEYLDIYTSGRRAEAVRLRDEKLLSTFDRHIATIGAAADAIEFTSLATSKDYSGRTNSLSTIVLGVASWPVILLFGLLLLTAVFVIAMMIAFRGKDLSDMP